MMRKTLMTLAAVFTLAGSAYAEDLVVPHPFTPGTTISSSDMNENFSTIYQKYNDLMETVSALTNKINTIGGELLFSYYANALPDADGWEFWGQSLNFFLDASVKLRRILGTVI